MNHLRPFLVCLVLGLLAASSAEAVTYFVPTDREMIQKSDDVVIATGVTSIVERNARGGIVTRTTLRIEDVLKGPRSAGQHLVLVERGGVLDDEATYIPGTPVYQPGERYLVFTSANRELEPNTFGMSLGQFFFEGDLLLRADVHGFDTNLEAHVEQARDAKKFTDYIRGIVARNVDPAPDYFVGMPTTRARGEERWQVASAAFTRGSYLMKQGSSFFRWQSPVATFVKSGTQPVVNGSASVTKAFAQWNSTESDIDYKDGGQDNTALDGLDDDDGKNAILFNDPNGEIDDNSQVAGIGGITRALSPVTLDGESFFRVMEVDVVMANKTFAQNCFDSVMTHEVGHTLGFRHSNQNNGNDGACEAPLECATVAIMNSSVNCTHNGVLRAYDKSAAATVYGSGVTNPEPGCTAPSISSQPQNKSIVTGKSASLQVTAAGTAPLTYAWFIGAVGNTGTLVPNSNNASISVSPLVTTAYWVRVTGQCGAPAQSNAVTVTVTPCPEVAIQSVSATPVLDGNTTLNVNATSTGQTLTYTWFRGNTPGDGGAVVGNTKQLTVAVTQAANYWVRVSNGCGNTKNSDLVAVAPCVLPVINVQPEDQTIASGAKATLNVQLGGTGSSVTWYRGVLGDKTNVAGLAASIEVGPLTETTQFWAEVKNTCGPVATRQVTVNVTQGPTCTAPSITTQPLSQEVKSGTLRLTVVATGTETLTYQWFEGTDKPVGTGSATLDVTGIAKSTSYFVRVTNSCGTVDSAVAQITVPPAKRRAVGHR
ncbi:MAG TPA: M57 family metalloprotease [Thermoanaerobaculia bacterium]|nr:M57 family metalloprotease [Thermoanaerobaculia bacterium]